MNEHLIDSKERSAALDTNRSHHVESPAGSGKTLLLTTRFLKILGEVNHPREILALTFTEKAAGEMKNRIISYLTRAGRKESPSNTLDAELLGLGEKALKRHEKSIQIITSSNGLNIMTFHGFFNYLTRRAPLEAGVSPDYEIMDEETKSLLMSEVTEKFFRNTFSYPKNNINRISLENRLLNHNNNWKILEEELKEIIEKRDRFGDLVRFIREAGNRGLSRIPGILEERIRPYIERLLGELRERFMHHDPAARWEDFVLHLKEKYAEIATALPSSLPNPSWEEIHDWQKIAEILLTKAGTPRKSFGPKNGFYRNFGKSEWGKAISGMEPDLAKNLSEMMRYPSLDDTESDINALSDFIIVAAAVIEQYETLCRKRHLSDFVSLEQSALRVLNKDNPSDLHLFLDHRIQHVLIDEFQDTSRIQWNLIKRLCGGWLPGDDRTLFIVGDPKQSIYAFRNAEVALFREAKSGIPLSGHGVLPLTSHVLKANFRSSERLIQWTNDLFGKTVMTEPDLDADEISFSPSAPCGKKEDRSLISLNLFANENNERAREKEAKWLARSVKYTIDETAGEKSIAVLLFTRNRLNRYLGAFKDEGVPIQVQEGLSLIERPEIRHLIQAARLIAMPHDDLAWASLLRSPWSWFDISTLLKISRQKPKSWREKIGMAAESDQEIRKILDATDRAFLRAGRDPLGTVVRKLWEDLEGPAKTARFYGMAGVANCRQFFRVLEDMEEGIPQQTITRFQRAMEGLYQPADPTVSRSSVQMMTIHRAKGLEFDIVFLPFMDWRPLASGPAIPPPYFLERIPGRGGKNVIAMGTDRRVGEPSKTYALLKKLRRDRKWGEAKRWFYVASTRARDSLIMSGVAGMKEDRISVPEKSILKWVMDHEKINGMAPADIMNGKKRTLSIEVNPEIEPPPAATPDHETELSEPCELSPQRLTYQTDFPSSLTYDETETTGATDTLRAVSKDAIRGIVIHRAMSTYIRKASLPSKKAVRIALVNEGITEKVAEKMAGEILREVGSAVKEPFLAGLIGSSNPIVETEWPIEDMSNERRLRSGIIDLAVFDGKTWWVVDFKTSRPKEGEKLEVFLKGEEKKYTPQIDNYRSMLKNFINDDSPEIRSGIYLTALQLWMEIKNI
ncbi:MAG: UvrD-helicase domain-containing protein [Thermodesulfobacteriota bacterium]|nr:UvrD-helicase domain-containing protein [Thermodesulfobacteriota bacterium]